MAFHVTTSLTNPFYGVSMDALAQGSDSGGSGGDVCASEVNCARINGSTLYMKTLIIEDEGVRTCCKLAHPYIEGNRKSN